MVCGCGTSAPSATAQHDRSHTNRTPSDVSGHATGDAHAACLASMHRQKRSLHTKCRHDNSSAPLTVGITSPAAAIRSGL
jgi:hypothetical protein